MPIISLLSSFPKEGFAKHALVVRSEDVNLKSAQFQDYKAVTKRWRAQDFYMNPGPIQFNYEAIQDRDIADSLKLSF